MVSIIRAKRTAIAKYNGMYKDVELVDFSADLLKSITSDIKVDEVILGNVLANNLGQNIARQISIKGNLGKEVPAFLVNMVCGSGMKAIELGYNSIVSGNNDIVLVGGIEKMTGSENMLKDGLTDAFSNIHMGITAENIVDIYGFSREDLDDFAFNSQKKAQNAIENGYFKEEIYNEMVDEYPRFNLEREKLSKLKTVFKDNGKVTAGNSSGINDGAAMLILASSEYVKENNMEILANIKGVATVGNDPSVMGLAPIYSTKKLLEKFNLTVEDIDIFEVNEAFSAVSLAFNKELNIPEDKVNVNGGAIALGHPIGASGARIVVTLVHELIRRNLKRGIATLCIGGGQGISILIER
ncbi:thiolase family protein [Streptobacillus ratti]|uniref:thiolase family protein n=1 Tax=Streptobacillus ratti TaxID=1720557 RepID=UPI000933DACF|nr:thiolase family protein [Streptobacillus ratti]